MPHRRSSSPGPQSLLSRFPVVQPWPLLVPRSPPSTACPHPPPQVSELRQQLRLQGLPVSGTKSMLLQRMRGGAPPREPPQPRRQGCPGGASWPRRRPEAPGGASVRAGRCTCGPARRSHSGTGRRVGKRVGNDVGGVARRKGGDEEPMKARGGAGGGAGARAEPGRVGPREPQVVRGSGCGVPL